MIEPDSYIYKKEVDWSLLHQGFTIPVSIQVVFQRLIRSALPRGTAKEVNLIIDNEIYPVKLVNQKFDEEKYPTHKDIVQFRYSPNSELTRKIRAIFRFSYEYLGNMRNIKKGYVQIPDRIKEYLILYTTQLEDTFLIDYITSEDFKNINAYISAVSEDEFELGINYNKIDLSAKIEYKTQIVKIRKLDKSICDNLKLLYDYNCQICGQNFGKIYGGRIVEAHHIDPFTTSFNNNSNNILIICPNHHRLIHNLNPAFDMNRFLFVYPNEFREAVRLNRHL